MRLLMFDQKCSQVMQTAELDSSAAQRPSSLAIACSASDLRLLEQVHCCCLLHHKAAHAMKHTFRAHKQTAQGLCNSQLMHARLQTLLNKVHICVSTVQRLLSLAVLCCRACSFLPSHLVTRVYIVCCCASCRLPAACCPCSRGGVH
jgi:hypothetical protein